MAYTGVSKTPAARHAGSSPVYGTCERQRMNEGHHGAGKGDTYRKVDLEQYGKNYDAIFHKKPKRKPVRTKKKASKP
jgi:hypothetical protein